MMNVEVFSIKKPRHCFWFLPLLALSCKTPALHVVERTRFMMDTAVSIKIFLPDSSGARPAAAAIDTAFAKLARLDSMLSSYREDSEVAAINRALQEQGVVSVSSDVDSIVSVAQYVSSTTAGAFDLTIAPVLRLWGFGADTLEVPAPDEITSHLPLVNFRRLELRHDLAPQTHTSLDSIKKNIAMIRFEQPNMAIDLGGIAKGYAADVAERVLAQHGYQDVLIAVGGDLSMNVSNLTAGRRYVWIKHPRRPERFFARFRCDRGGVSTGGDYERFFEKDGKRYHHIINPQTGFPAGRNADGSQTVSATVVANKTILSDAFSTALFVLGPQRGIELAERLPDLEAVVVFIANGKLEWRATSGLREKLEIIDTEI